MELKTKQMKNMLGPIQQQTSKLLTLLMSVSTNPSEILAVKSTLFEQHHSLTQRFKNLTNDDNSDCEEANVKIADAKHTSLLKDIDELIKSVKSNTTDKYAAKQMTELLLSKFTSALQALEDLECLPLKQRLQDCLDYVREMNIANEIEDLQNIKELGTSILEIFEPLQKYRRSLVSVFLSEKLALFTSQLCTSFEMLVQLAQQQHWLNAPIYACKKYICERICACCEKILELLNGTNPSPEEEACEKQNHFVYRMDLALDIILEMPTKPHEEQLSECAELWLRLEDVFSHAMAITQVCQPYNFKAITGSCQSIVLEYEKLKQELQLETPDSALNNLFMHTLTDALYRLERKVNIAILTLAMEVFSTPYAALKKLVMTCGNSLSAKRRSKNDLNGLVEDFDQLFDQTVQIGIYAIACCKNMNRNNKIRNCLAGFESLETELISAVTSFYLHPDNKEMRSSVKLLTTQWQLEMNRFQNTVNLIINSAAFCHVVMDSLQERITAISDCLDNRQPVTQLQIQGIVQRASSLSSQITAVVNDIGTENIDRQTIMMTRELKAAIFEANAAAKTLLVENATEPQQLRVIKRCELILNVVQRLQPALSTLMNSTMLEKSSRSREDSKHGSISNVTNFPSVIYGLPRNENSLVYIRTPYTVKAYKPQVSIQLANSTIQKPSDLSCLLSYIKSGRTLRSEHSIMYNMPHKNKNKDKDTTEPLVRNEASFRNLSSVRQHLFSRNNFTANGNIDMTEESLNLTAVLEKLTSPSTSASSTFSVCQSLKKQDISSGHAIKEMVTNKVGKLSGTGRLETEICLNGSAMTEKVGECTMSGGGDASLIMETCQKLSSVRLSNNKIQKSASGQHEVYKKKRRLNSFSK
ncbi:Serendipity locus protein alpha [Ooceraea biroi]|uniref:Serendipity locus protein alpha n=1 Tax=Ooceraea biroi TaxID=2015173 RepID=A0A026WXC8_OOCBI|nr:Serendipity locus protein alpha [Ooceraea biroi]